MFDMAESDVEEASVDGAAEIVGDGNWSNFKLNCAFDVDELELSIEVILKFLWRLKPLEEDERVNSLTTI